MQTAGKELEKYELVMAVFPRQLVKHTQTYIKHMSRNSVVDDHTVNAEIFAVINFCG